MRRKRYIMPEKDIMLEKYIINDRKRHHDKKDIMIKKTSC